jgi:hypothetical protein
MLQLAAYQLSSLSGVVRGPEQAARRLPIQTMKLRVSTPALAGAMLCTALFAASQARADIIQNTDNGHYYEAVTVAAGITWTDANAAAQAKTYNGLHGHLVTITSDSEQSFINTKLPSTARYIIGGYQPAGSAEPNGGWSWVTGEKWEYINWDNGEPNNVGEEDRLVLSAAGNGTWNDILAVDPFPGYIVEYEAPRLVSITSPNKDFYGGRKSNVTVNLNFPALTGGAQVSLSSDNPAAVVPVSVTVPAGQSSVTFVMTTSPVTTAQTVTLTATYGSDTAKFTFSLHRVRIKTMTLSPNSLDGGTTGHGVIVLEAPTPVDLTLILESSNTAASTVPASITIAGGSFFGVFAVQAKAVTATASTVITARGAGASVSEKLTVFPASK